MRQLSIPAALAFVIAASLSHPSRAGAAEARTAELGARSLKAHAALALCTAADWVARASALPERLPPNAVCAEIRTRMDERHGAWIDQLDRRSHEGGEWIRARKAAEAETRAAKSLPAAPAAADAAPAAAAEVAAAPAG